MTRKQKLLVSLLRAFCGYYGVDAFVMKKIAQGVTRLVIGVVLEVLSIVLTVLALTVGGTGLILTNVVVSIFICLRAFLYLLGGLLMLKKPEEEILEMYK